MAKIIVTDRPQNDELYLTIITQADGDIVIMNPADVDPAEIIDCLTLDIKTIRVKL